MNRLRLTPSIIPNLFTAMNMFCGFLSIINSSQLNYNYAAWLIVIAAVFDTLDGAMARLTNSSSELGVELDSLSDVVSFGAAPSFLIYATYLHNLNSLGVVIASLPLIAGGFRLARFNVQLVGYDKAYFKGLPIPLAALTLAAFCLAFFQKTGYPENLKIYIVPLVVILAFLMVSTIKYDTLPKFTKKDLKEKPQFIITIIIGVSLLIIFPIVKAIFFTFVFILLFGIFRHIINYFKRKH